MFLFCVFSIKDQISLKLVNKDQFWFLLMLRNSSAEVRRKKSFREMQIAQTVTVVTKVANERYLPYIQLCVNAFFVNFMY